MGAGNAKAVYARWRELPHLPFRVLTWMALRSMDDQDQPLYWAGWEDLALACGRSVPDADLHRPPVTTGCDVCSERRAALRAVTAAIAKLIDAGAIRQQAPAAPGRNAYYALNLSLIGTVHAEREASAGTVHAEPGQGENRVNGARSAALTVHVPPTDGARSAALTVHAERAPEEYRGVLGHHGGTEAADVVTSGPVSRARATLTRSQVSTGVSPAAATAAAAEPLPPKCEHGFRARRRQDGTSSCALCRRVVTTMTTREVSA